MSSPGFVSSCRSSDVRSAPTSRDAASKRAADLLAKMTLDEKIGQLNQLFFLSQLMKPEMMEPDIREGKVGSLLFVTDPVLINRFQKVAVEQSRLKIPLLFGFDVIHGFRTVFPVPLAMASSWDPAMVERAQTIARRGAGGRPLDVCADGGHYA